MMHKLPTRHAIALALFAILICGAVQTATCQENQSTTESHRIEGGWFFTVTVPPGTPGPEQFQTLDSFAAGGGWSGHAATDSFTNWSPAYGTWKKTGNEYVITQYQFTQDPSGNPTGLVIIHREMHFTGPDSMAGESKVSFCDLAAANCFNVPAPAQIVGHKIIAAGPDGI